MKLVYLFIPYPKAEITNNNNDKEIIFLILINYFLKKN